MLGPSDSYLSFDLLRLQVEVLVAKAAHLVLSHRYRSEYQQ